MIQSTKTIDTKQGEYMYLHVSVQKDYHYIAWKKGEATHLLHALSFPTSKPSLASASDLILILILVQIRMLPFLEIESNTCMYAHAQDVVHAAPTVF